MRYVASVGDRKFSIDVQENGHVRQVSVDGRDITVNWQVVGHDGLSGMDADQRAAHYSILAGERSYEAYVRLPGSGQETGEEAGRTVEVSINGRPYAVIVQDERSQVLESLAGGAHVSGDAIIRAPMPGLVRYVRADVGAEVKRGQTVVVLEAMKMENDLPTPRAGVVKAVRVTAGQTVNQGDVLAVVGDPPDIGKNDPPEER